MDNAKKEERKRNQSQQVKNYRLDVDEQYLMEQLSISNCMRLHLSQIIPIDDVVETIVDFAQGNLVPCNLPTCDEMIVALDTDLKITDHRDNSGIECFIHPRYHLSLIGTEEEYTFGDYETVFCGPQSRHALYYHSLCWQSIPNQTVQTFIIGSWHEALRDTYHLQYCRCYQNEMMAKPDGCTTITSVKELMSVD